MCLLSTLSEWSSMKPCVFVCNVIAVHKHRLTIVLRVVLSRLVLQKMVPAACSPVRIASELHRSLELMCMYSCLVLALSDKVVFAPCSADVIGIFDVSTNRFETVSTGSVTGGGKFVGATAVGSKVVFAPYCADVIGIFDVSANKFETVSTGSVTGGGKFAGAAANTS